MTTDSLLTQITKLISGHRGNQNLKKAGEKIAFTEANALEWLKCRDDPIYFINTYCKIISLDEGLIPFKTFGYQDRSIRAMHENRNTIHLYGRQCGKCCRSDTVINIRQKSTGKKENVSARYGGESE